MVVVATAAEVVAATTTRARVRGWGERGRENSPPYQVTHSHGIITVQRSTARPYPSNASKTAHTHISKYTRIALYLPIPQKR